MTEGQAFAIVGKVSSWNDKEIAALNGGVTLPSTKISVCHRSDESGTTKNFTQFLAAYSPEWTSGPGVDKSVKWPTGTGAKGNDGVAGCVKQTAGAVGYVVFSGQKLMDAAQPSTAAALTLWFKTTHDCSSAVTGSSVFDFTLTRATPSPRGTA